MSEQGWFRLHRSIVENCLWQDKPFAKGQAWIDLLAMANHKDNRFLLGNEMVFVPAGGFITSELKLMERWGWGKAKVRSFLKMLEKNGMIEKKTDHKKTTIFIVNWGKFQCSETTDRPPIDREQTASRPLADTNNNDKNEKNEKKYKRTAKNPFCQFPQNDYDFAKLEEELKSN